MMLSLRFLKLFACSHPHPIFGLDLKMYKVAENRGNNTYCKIILEQLFIYLFTYLLNK